MVVMATPVAMAGDDSRTPPIFTPSYVNIAIMLRNDYLNIVKSTLSSRRRSGTVCKFGDRCDSDEVRVVSSHLSDRTTELD